MDNQKLQRSFSIIDDDQDFTKDINGAHFEDHIPGKKIQHEALSDLSDFEDNSTSSNRQQNNLSLTALDENETVAHSSSQEPSLKFPSTSRKKDMLPMKMLHISSDSEDSENEDKKKVGILGEYDPQVYENLEVDQEIKDMFQFIFKYIPQDLNLDTKLKPFIPEFLPAVGDIDAFLKVVPPKKTLSGEHCDPDQFTHFGLTVLDEPATNQSDPALLYLQLRATSVNPGNKNDVKAMVKKLDNTEKNAKVIEKWIKDISDLHKTKSSPVVRYSEPMPELDDLMQEWSEEMENKLKIESFPDPKDSSLSEYIDRLCKLFQIPLVKKKIQSVHLLLCLYAAIKQTQFYKRTSTGSDKKSTNNINKEADQLVLE